MLLNNYVINLLGFCLFIMFLHQWLKHKISSRQNALVFIYSRKHFCCNHWYLYTWHTYTHIICERKVPSRENDAGKLFTKVTIPLLVGSASELHEVRLQHVRESKKLDAVWSSGMAKCKLQCYVLRYYPQK